MARQSRNKFKRVGYAREGSGGVHQDGALRGFSRGIPDAFSKDSRRS